MTRRVIARSRYHYNGFYAMFDDGNSSAFQIPTYNIPSVHHQERMLQYNDGFSRRCQTGKR